MKDFLGRLRVDNEPGTMDIRYEIIRLRTEMAKINREVFKMKRTIEMIKAREWQESQD